MVLGGRIVAGVVAGCALTRWDELVDERERRRNRHAEQKQCSDGDRDQP
jgi:hypothetical protein